MGFVYYIIYYRVLGFFKLKAMCELLNLTNTIGYFDKLKKKPPPPPPPARIKKNI